MIKPFSRRSRFGGLFAAGAAAVIIAAGCGGGDGDSALSVDEYRDQANQICREADRTTDAIDVNSVEDFQALIDAQRSQIDELRELDPPDEFSDQHEEAIETLDRTVALLDDARQRIEDGEDPSDVLSDLQAEGEELTDRANELARELGLDDCVDGDDSDTGTDSGDDSGDSSDTLTPTPDAGDDSSDSGDTTTDSGDDSSDSSDAAPGSTQRYIQDATAAAGVLTAFGEALQGISNPSELETLAPQLRQNLADFDEAIQSMGSYTLDNAQLEQQRSCLVQTGPAVSDLLGQFITAAENADAGAIQGLVPDIQSTLTDFTQAAQGNC
ncbi:MAG: hypothetical protein ACR2N6_08385 [Miltoncostaeaceae bacterium]